MKATDKTGGPRFVAASIGKAALVAAMVATSATLPAFADAKSATLRATGYSGTETLDYFPALVKLSATDDAYGFSYGDCVDGQNDLWFEDSDGNVIPHEVDTWNASGDSYVWVRIPNLTSNSEIVMHWGATRTAAQMTTENVWTGYVGVWHMNATGTTPELDSTGHGLNAVPVDNSSAEGATTSIDTAASGKVGSGRASVSKKRLKVTGHTLSSASKFAVSGWFKTSSYTANDYPRLFSSNPNTTTRTYWELYRQDASKMYVCGGAADQKTIGGTMTLANNTWHYLTLVYDNTTATLYDNGVKKESSATITAANQNTYFTIGGLYHASLNRSFIGTLDEVRMYDGVVSADRVAADYKTMNEPTTFLTLVPDVVPVTATWTGAAGDGDVSNADNWNCYDEGGARIDGVLPAVDTAVTVSGDNLNIQIPAGSSFLCDTFTLGSATLARDCDLTGVDVVVASDATIDLKCYALFVKGLSGGGTITSTANGTYTTLDFIQADNSNGSQYIITDYTPRYSDTFVTKVNFQNTSAQCIYCARGNSVGSGSYTCLTYGPGDPLRFDHVTTTGSTSSTPTPPTDEDCTFSVNGKTGDCKLNGASIYKMATSSDDTATAASALSFFKLNNNASGTTMSSYGQANFKMYFFRIYDVNGAIVRDYVPAKNGSGVAGLWDRVNNAFWPSAGASQFIAGSETARGEVVFCGTGTWSGVTIAPAVTVVKDLGGTLTRSGGLQPGMSGDGTPSFVFDDGTAKFSTISAGQAEFNVHGGTVNVPTWIDWGSRANATAVWNQYGGAVSQSGDNFWIGRVSKGTGVYNLYGGTLTKSGGTFALGEVPGSTGYFNMTNGTFTSDVDMYLGADSGGVGHFTASGGTLNAHTLRVGNNGTGTFDQNGGSVNVDSYLFIGAESKSATGTYTMTGGTLKVPNQPVSVGRYGTGTFDISGTAVVTASKGVRVGFTNGSNAGTGTLVVTNGGTVATSSIYGGGSTDAQATVLFDGATVRATAAGNIVKDIANVTIGEGGLTIDTTSDNYALAIADSTLAVTPGATPSITLAGGGTLDVSTATIGLASAPASGTSSFDVAVAADGAAATFTGTPALASGVTGWKLIVADNGKRIRAVRKGVTVIVY